MHCNGLTVFVPLEYQVLLNKNVLNLLLPKYKDEKFKPTKYKCDISFVYFYSSMLKVDNDGEAQIAEDTYVKNEGYRLDLSASSGSYDKSKSFTSTGGHTVSLFIVF